jgi:type IV pilus assembly protein PilN
MIRINLLPVRQARKREYGRQQLVLLFFLTIFEVVLMYMLYTSKHEELLRIEENITLNEEALATVEVLEAEINELEEDLRSLRVESDTIENLESNRIGPGAVMDDLKFILNSATTTEAEREQVERRFGPVDPGGIWLDHIRITPDQMNLAGTALSPEGIAEFMFRLETSPPDIGGFFSMPDLLDWRTGVDSFFGRITMFEISSGIRYHRIEN